MLGSLATHQAPLMETTLGKQFERACVKSVRHPGCCRTFLDSQKRKYAGGVTPNMDSYSSETIQSVFTRISIFYRGGGSIAKPDHVKRQMHPPHVKVNPVIMAY